MCVDGAVAWPGHGGAPVKLPNIFETPDSIVHHRAGDVIFSVGEPAEVMYLVKSGEVEISKHGRVVETVGPDGFFGELALVDAQPRSASAVARTDCTLAKVTEKQFLFMVGETPFFALNVIRELAKRLRRTD